MKRRFPLSVLFYALSLLCFATGGMTYLLFRDRHLAGFRLLDWIGFGTMVDTARRWASHITLPEWVIYSMPDGLWAAAYILLMHEAANEMTERKRILLASLIPALGLLSETMQAMGILRGTYDTADMICYATPLAIYYTFTIIVK